MWIPAGLYGCALLVALCVQHSGSVLAGAWLPLFLGSCALMRPTTAPRDGTLIFLTVAWLLAITASTFFLAPVMGGATVGWTLAALPMLALSLRDSHMPSFLAVSFGVIFLFACGLILQVIIGVHYTAVEYHGHLHALPAWPLIDPNNAACVVNIGLIPCFYMALRKPAYIPSLIILVIALALTESKAGMLGAGVGCFMLARARWGQKVTVSCAALGAMAAAIFIPTNWVRLALAMNESFGPRLAMWHDTALLLPMRPFRGLGLGSYPFYYAQVRTETVTGGYFAHNDLLQMAVEMGFPCAAIFAMLWIVCAARARLTNLPAFATLSAVVIQASFEFQFYLPAISLLCGVALAYIINSPKPEKSAAPLTGLSHARMKDLVFSGS